MPAKMSAKRIQHPMGKKVDGEVPVARKLPTIKKKNYDQVKSKIVIENSDRAPLPDKMGDNGKVRAKRRN